MKFGMDQASSGRYNNEEYTNIIFSPFVGVSHQIGNQWCICSKVDYMTVARELLQFPLLIDGWSFPQISFRASQQKEIN
jgi:hypothetical protein